MYDMHALDPTQPMYTVTVFMVDLLHQSSEATLNPYSQTLENAIVFRPRSYAEAFIRKVFKASIYPTLIAYHNIHHMSILKLGLFLCCIYGILTIGGYKWRRILLDYLNYRNECLRC